jgi:hypothetical protein
MLISTICGEPLSITLSTTFVPLLLSWVDYTLNCSFIGDTTLFTNCTELLTSISPGALNGKAIDAYEALADNLKSFKPFYPAMTAFTDQYSLPNIFFDIGQL